MKNNTIQKNIPQGWQEKKLGDVCDIVNGSTPKRSVSEYWENGNIPWFTVDDIRSNGRIISKTNQSITGKALKETSVKLLPEDSVLLCCTASLGEVAITKIPLTTNQQFNGLVSKDKKNLFPFYLFYSAQKFGENLKSKSGKTTINFLSVSSLSKEKVLLPPIKEQKRIAEILGIVDEDIAKTQEVIEATEKLKLGLMQQLFTPKKDWIDVTLNGVSAIIMGQSPSSKNYNEIDNGLPLIQGNADIKNRRSIKRFSTSEITKEINEGDIIMSVRAPVGCIATASFDSCIGRGICGIQPKNIDKNYLYYYLISKENEFEKKAQGSTFTAINSNEVRKISILYPKNKNEQKEISDILSSIDEKISINKRLKQKLNLLKKGLMQDLLSGKVRTK